MSPEIRPIRAYEAEAFWAVLVECFHLDPGRQWIFQNEPYFDLNRKWGAWKDGRLVTILTTVPLTFGWGRAIGIAGVATLPEFRGQGLAEAMLRTVLAQAETDGEGPALLFAHETTVYRRVGFELMDTVVRGTLIGSDLAPAQPFSGQQVREMYAAWSAQDPDRLVRDARRWQYWEWFTRTCEAVGPGYLCLEPPLVREALGIPTGLSAWPVPAGTDWLGLKSMTDQLGVPLLHQKQELMLMARGFSRPPQMFMTDQF